MAACLTHLEEYVKNLYLKISITKPQQLCFQKIREALGIKVFYWPDASQALFSGNQSYIVLNESLSPQQQWQDFCHELAHILLHTGNQGRLSPLFIEYQENKANSFMYHAAIPTFMLDQLTTVNVAGIQQLFNVEYDFAVKRLDQYINNKYSILNWNTEIEQRTEIHINQV